MLRMKELLALLALTALLTCAFALSAAGGAPTAAAAQQTATDLPEAGAIIQVNDIEMYYEVYGEGEPLLLIHSGITSAEDFAAVIPAFVDAGYQAIAMDCRGRGRSTDSGQPLSYALMASDVVALMDELGIEKAHIAGQSDGAIIALHMAIYYPERVGKIVSYGANFNPNGLFPSLREFAENITLAEFDAMIGNDYRRLAPNPDYLPVMLEKFRHMMLTQPNFTLEQLMGIQSPVLVFDGEEEDNIRIEHARLLAAAIPDSTLVIQPGTGHALMYEDPQLYLDTVLPFLAGELDAPPVGKYAKVNDIAMYYEVYGEGEPVLLIHSVAASMAQLSDVIPVLAEKYQVIAVDFRGHGCTTDSGQPLSYELAASDVVALMDTLGIDAANIVGNKDGGIIGLVMATQYPERVNKLVAASVNYSPAGFQPWFGDWVKSVTLDDWHAMTGDMYAKIAPDPSIDPVMLEKDRILLLTEPNLTLEELSTITAPTLVMAGADEEVLQIPHVEELAAAIPDAELVLIPEAGHGVLDEQFEAWMEAVVNFLAEPAVEAAQTVPRYEPSECKYSFPEGEQVECGYLVVPEDRTQPDGPTIRLHVVNLKSRGATTAPDPIILVPGGPGAPGAFFVMIWTETPIADVFRAERDTIMLEHRGANFSEPAFYCPEMEADLADVAGLSFAEEIERSAVAYRACHDRLVAEGYNLSAYSAVEAAADIADLRVAMGYDEVNVYGVSYGTLPAMHLLRDQPEGIRSVVLDSVFPPDLNSTNETLTVFQGVLDAVFAACAADSACDAAYPDLENVFVETLAQLRDEPVTVTVQDDAGQSYDVTVDDLKFVEYIFDSGFMGEDYGNVPAAMYSIRNGDLQAVAQGWLGYVGGRHGPTGPGSWASSMGLYNSTMCLQDGYGSDAEQARAVYDAVETDPSVREWAKLAIAQEWLGPCADWDVTPATPEAVHAPVVGDVPTLVTVNTFDIFFAPYFGDAAVAGLSHGYLYEFPMSHASLMSGCGLDMMAQFWRDPSQSPDASCIDAMTLNWVLPE